MSTATSTAKDMICTRTASGRVKRPCPTKALLVAFVRYVESVFESCLVDREDSFFTLWRALFFISDPQDYPWSAHCPLQTRKCVYSSNDSSTNSPLSATSCTSTLYPRLSKCLPARRYASTRNHLLCIMEEETLYEDGWRKIRNDIWAKTKKIIIVISNASQHEIFIAIELYTKVILSVILSLLLPLTTT